MKKQLFSILFILLLVNAASAQIKGSFSYQGVRIGYLAQNNHQENDFDYPGMRAYIIVSDALTDLISAYNKDQFRTLQPQLTTGYTAVFYLNAKDVLVNGGLAAIKVFTEHINKVYFVDRNRIHLVLLSNEPHMVCDSLNSANAFIASINAADPELRPCSGIVKPLYEPTRMFGENLTARTSLAYPVPGYTDMTRIAEEKQSEDIGMVLKGRQRKSWFDLTVGNFNIGDEYRTVTDTLTGVNLANYHTLYNLQAGMQFGRRIGVFGTLGFIYSGQQKSIKSIDNNGDGWTVHATGTAGLMVRYGLGINVTAFTRKRWKFDVSLAAGGLKAITGGGETTKTIGGGNSGIQKDIEKQKASAVFLSPAINARYYFGKAFYFTTNLQYNRAPFSQPIGSTTGNTGYALNFGFGFTFYPRNRHE